MKNKKAMHEEDFWSSWLRVDESEVKKKDKQKPREMEK